MREIEISLNIMKDTPFMIVSAVVTDQIKNDMREQHPSRIHQIGRSSIKYLLSVLEYDSEHQVLNDLDVTNSHFIEGGSISSLIEYSDNSFMICGWY